MSDTDIIAHGAVLWRVTDGGLLHIDKRLTYHESMCGLAIACDVPLIEGPVARFNVCPNCQKAMGI